MVAAYPVDEYNDRNDFGWRRTLKKLRNRHWAFGMALAAATLLSGTVLAQPGSNPESAAKPTIEVPETSFDFGYVGQNAKISHVFWMKNTGGDTLFIQDIKPG